MAARDPQPEDVHQQRLAAWTRESRALQSTPGSTGEGAAVHRYATSRRRPALLPHPRLVFHEHAREKARHQQALRRALSLLVLALGTALLGIFLPSGARLALWTVALVSAVAAAFSARSARRIEAVSYLRMRAGLAEAWSDWNAALARVNAVDGATDAREILGADEPRMAELVLALARAENSAENSTARTRVDADARTWVYATAARAVALADAAERDQMLRAITPS